MHRSEVVFTVNFNVKVQTILSINHGYISANDLIVNFRDGTKPIPSTRSIGYRVNFKVSVSPKNLIPIPSTFRYYFDTFPILYILVYYNEYNEIQTEHNTLDLKSLCSII